MVGRAVGERDGQRPVVGRQGGQHVEVLAQAVADQTCVEPVQEPQVHHRGGRLPSDEVEALCFQVGQRRRPVRVGLLDDCGVLGDR